MIHEVDVKNQIIKYLLVLIESERFNFKDKIPSENFLATKFKISRSTVRNVLTELTIRGLLKPQKGSGYYLSEDFYLNKIRSVTENMKINKEDIYIKSNLNESDFKDIISRFNIDESQINIDDFVPYIKVYYVDDMPVRYSQTFINKKMFSEIDFTKVKKSVISYLKEEDIRPTKQTTIVKITTKNDTDSIFLYDDSEKLIVERCSIMFYQENSIIEVSKHRVILSYYNTTYIRYL